MFSAGLYLDDGWHQIGRKRIEEQDAKAVWLRVFDKGMEAMSSI